MSVSRRDPQRSVWDVSLPAENQGDRDEQDQTGLLERVFAEQFKVVAAAPQVRKGECPGAVKNRHDAEVRWAAKDTDKKTAWVGYKMQIAETVPKENASPPPKGRPHAGSRPRSLTFIIRLQKDRPRRRPKLVLPAWRPLRR